MFQTLPGIILHFYRQRLRIRNNRQEVSNPSRDYSAFLRAFQVGGEKGLHLFQTLPGIILHFYTRCTAPPIRAIFLFQTLPGIILHFYYLGEPVSQEGQCGFKPFQGLFCISTKGVYFLTCFHWVVSNPSRDYSAFLPA